jgi:SRSO17 transposase
VVGGARRADGTERFYLTNLPATTTLTELAQTIKARWNCEPVHQQLKEELGLDHFEGRSWTGLHHHELLTMIAFAFLQHYRLAHPAPRPRRPRSPKKTAGGNGSAAHYPGQGFQPSAGAC